MLWGRKDCGSSYSRLQTVVLEKLQSNPCAIQPYYAAFLVTLTHANGQFQSSFIEARLRQMGGWWGGGVIMRGRGFDVLSCILIFPFSQCYCVRGPPKIFPDYEGEGIRRLILQT